MKDNPKYVEALKQKGTFYLPYLPYYNEQQLKAAYPEVDEFFRLKRLYDPHEIFTNYFYEKYSHGNNWR